MRKQRRKMLLILFIILFSLTSFYIGRVIANPGSIQTVLEEGSLTETASYVIFTDGSTVYAKNGLSGTIEFSGTDASTVIQNAINALTNGGKIFIKSGTYALYSPLTINKVLTIEGESSASTIIKAPPGDYAIKIGDGITRKDGNVFSNFWIQPGDTTSKGGMYFNYTTQNIIYKITISYFSKPYEFVIVFDNSWENKVIDSSFFNNQNGLKQFNIGYTYIYSSYINAWSYGPPATENIALYAAGGPFIAFGTGIEGSGEATNIGLKSDWPGGNRLFGCAFELGTLSKDIIIDSNQLYDSVSYGSFFTNVDDPNKHFHAYDTHGYTTKNSGTATVVNNDWLAHGLVSTPKIVTLTPRSQVTVWANNRNTTHFQIGVSSGTVTVDWYAEV